MTRAARRSRNATRRGFSLLEVLVAAVILAGAVVVILESISSGRSAAGRLRRRLAARHLAGDVLARAATGSVETMPRTGDRRRGGGRFRWVLTDAPARRAGLRRLTCTVRWRRRGRERVVVLHRLVAGAEEAPP